mmetsp:Transcript_26420/g.69417  ORF Transcript_26420/g.69417 Transcript_26420/m.69417 type:complete len:110 (+) Transcript_26420:691-1020(+)
MLRWFAHTVFFDLQLLVLADYSLLPCDTGDTADSPSFNPPALPPQTTAIGSSKSTAGDRGRGCHCLDLGGPRSRSSAWLWRTRSRSRAALQRARAQSQLTEFQTEPGPH